MNHFLPVGVEVSDSQTALTALHGPLYVVQGFYERAVKKKSYATWPVIGSFFDS
jgi:hypothetical protein